jgi:outer membrane protein assembly factor BamB
MMGDDDTLWALSNRGTLWAIDPGAEPRVVAALGSSGVSVPPSLGRDGGLRIALRHGEIVCVDRTGAERWRRGIDGPASPMLLAADDTALLVSAAGTLYAIDREGTLRWRVATEIRGGGRPVLAWDGTIYLVGRGGRIEAWR